MTITQHKLTLLTLALYWPALIFFAHIPVPESVRSAQVSDKSLHFQAYLVLTFLIWFSVKPREKINWRKIPVWLILFGLTAYGAIDEVIQGLIGRNCDAMDLATNVIAILCGLLLLTFVSFLPAALLVSGIVIFGISNVAKTDLTELFPLAYFVFHFVAYSIFTTFWILNMDFIVHNKLEKLQRLIMSAGIPVCFLIIVRISSSFLGKGINSEDIIIPVTAIVIVAAAGYLKVFFFSKQTEANKTDKKPIT